MDEAVLNANLIRMGLLSNAQALVNPNEDAYLKLLGKILIKGRESSDRTGVGTFKLFGEQLEFDLRQGFPLLTTKSLHFKSILTELLWFLKGDTNIAYLKERGVSIWDEWADENGDLGPVYGHQWRQWGPNGFDQIRAVFNELKTNPDSRRLLVSAWNVEDLGKMALHPCHVLFQFATEALSESAQFFEASRRVPSMRGRSREVFEAHYANAKMPKHALHMKMYQRSADTFLGVPYNIASYTILLQLFAQKLNMVPGRLIVTFGDVHLYKNHVDQAKEQLCRTAEEPPVLTIDQAAVDAHDVWDMPYEAFSVSKYNPAPAIKASVAV